MLQLELPEDLVAVFDFDAGDESVDSLKIAADIGAAAHFVRLDVTDEESWIAAVTEAESRFGRLDVLVNNAGILQVGMIEDTALKDYEKRIQVIN